MMTAVKAVWTLVRKLWRGFEYLIALALLVFICVAFAYFMKGCVHWLLSP